MMPFTQFKLDRSSVQTRGIFNKYVYETDDPITEVLDSGYFRQSRFIELDGDLENSMGWKNGILEVSAEGDYYLCRITPDGLSAELIGDSFVYDPSIYTASFEVGVNTRYAIDSSGTAGAIVIAVPAGWPVNGAFRIQDVAASWTGVDFVTVDFISSGYLFQGVNQNYEGNVPNDGESFVIRDASYGFELL